jgi:3D (Asp-Asp-Asp) domain-containing protein
VKCCGKTDGITATGVKAKEGRTIAADPKIFPYGTKILIDGNVYTVEDCGSAIKNNKVDIFFESHEKALNFGVQYLTAYVKGE